MRRPRAAPALFAVAFSLLARPALADAPNDTQAPAAPARDARNDVPIVAYTYSAYGAPAGSYGAYGYGMGLVGSGQPPTGGGGATAWGSPVDRLTIVVDALRDVYLFDHFAPSAAAIVRIAGRAGDGPSLAALGKYKVEGFGSDPNGEIDSEVESGLLFSYARRAFHFDANALSGFGLGDHHELDGEARLRIGYDLASWLRAGADAQARFRFGGALPLAGGRAWDFAGGPQLVFGRGRLFGALTAGPTSMGIASAGVVGWSVIASVGGTM